MNGLIKSGYLCHPLHGRYHSLQADSVGITVEEDSIIIKGTFDTPTPGEEERP